MGKFKHGMRKKPEYRCWSSLKNRCTNENDTSFEFCKHQLSSDWFSFETFYRDMGPKPSPKSCLVRLDSNKLYGKSNCVWGTRKDIRELRRKDNRVNRTNIQKKDIETKFDEDWISVYF